MDWTQIESPSLGDFESLARDAFATLPSEFRDLTGAVLFRIEDFPDEDVMREMGLESEFDILGLFQGPNLADHEAGRVHGHQTMIFLYRRPILDYWAEHSETLGAVIRHVLIHEIGHHFGLSDEDMDAIEDDVD
ncbi:MAG TPA: metallopeptidase family protein [Rhizomicrobium sp.]|jgi:predicted Zn-dependent protease with MMP-like domain|nr:metallopeptidase family protein [Rhizomicrobium sp.]